jgi:type VI secretion system protein ImpA
LPQGAGRQAQWTRTWEGIVSAFDIESLLGEVSPETRCGEDISQNSEFFELETLVRPKPPGAVQTAEEAQTTEPNWMEIRRKAFGLLQRSRHLQVALYFSLALLTTEGLSGLRDGLYLIRGLLERFWDDLHPRLDPEDGNDPTERMNILLPLSLEPASQWDPVRFRSRLVRVPLCNSRRAGGFSLRDIQTALGEKTTADGVQKAPQMPIIQAAFRETTPEELQGTLGGACQAIEHLDGIRNVFRERTQDGTSPDLSGLRGDLEKIRRVLKEYAATGPATGKAVPDDITTDLVPERESTTMTGEIRSRSDALAAIERACRYFEGQEPSSPVPLLLRRAQRLASKTFLEIIKDVCPGAMDQVTAVSGAVSGESNSDGVDTGQT